MHIGDTITIIDTSVAESGTTGKIIEIYPDGDVRALVHGQHYVLSPSQFKML